MVGIGMINTLGRYNHLLVTLKRHKTCGGQPEFELVKTEQIETA